MGWSNCSTKLVITEHAMKTLPCVLGWCLYTVQSIPHCFRRLLTTSWRNLASCFMVWSALFKPLGVVNTPVESLYPPSATTCSPLSNICTSICRAIFISGHAPHGYGPLTHTILHVCIQTPISYRTPGLLYLCEYHLRSKGDGSCIRQSVPSTVIKLQLPLEHLYLSSNLI